MTSTHLPIFQEGGEWNGEFSASCSLKNLISFEIQSQNKIVAVRRREKTNLDD